MKKPRTRLLHLHYVKIGRRLTLRLLKKDPSLSFIYSDIGRLQAFYSISYKYASSIHKRLHKTYRCEIFRRTILQNETLTILDSNYPKILSEINDPPLVLYVSGDIDILNEKRLLSVIGSRQPTNQAWRKVNYIVPPLVKDNWVIVSGMARGIDSFAHEITLKSSGQTIAILGGGFNHIYPRENQSLFQKISATGLVLSEYTPQTEPRRYHFPERNRIISGLSFGTLVIEAKQRSGTMITVDQALDQGREIYAIPGTPFEELTKGCNTLIQDGAKLVQHPTDISDDWEQFGKHVSRRN